MQAKTFKLLTVVSVRFKNTIESSSLNFGAINSRMLLGCDVFLRVLLINDVTS